MMKERATIFIDGNNFYHGMKAIGLPCGCELNYAQFSRNLVLDREWQETRYYIGRVKREGDITRYSQQRKFFDFLKGLERVSYHTGRIESRLVSGAAKKLRNWISGLQKRQDISLPQNVIAELSQIAGANTVRYVEKAVDVMIAVDMVAMAYNGEYESAYLISADGDFTHAVKKVRAAGKKVFVASPGPGIQLKHTANAFIPLTRESFNGCWL